MDNLAPVRLFLDWGFTRFKIWLLDINGAPLYEQSIFTASLSRDSIFYWHDDLDRVRNVIINVLQMCVASPAIHIYTSSQMHALAGTLIPDLDFISTWNDLPQQRPPSAAVRIKDGIPVLDSMPLNKIIQNSGSRYLNSAHYSQRAKDAEEVLCVSSPFALVFHRIFHCSIPCSRSWWQSTCLDLNQLDPNLESSSCYLSETPLFIPASHSLDVLGVHVAITIYPEVGDLQASTFASIHQSQLLINLGTGSQVIFPALTVSHALPFYRYYTEMNNPIPTISHVPCGRLLSDYVAKKHLSFSVIKETLGDPELSKYIAKRIESIIPLLCFPGFSYHDCSYHQVSLTNINELARLSPADFLSVWVLQYHLIIRHYLPSSLPDDGPSSVSVIGDLGGLADDFCRLLAELLPPDVQLRREKSVRLPDSLLCFHHGIHGKAS